MMMEKLEQLLRTGKIEKIDYFTYLVFGGDNGRKLLNDLLLQVCLAEPPTTTSESFAWKDGRISIMRELKERLENVDGKLQGVVNNGDGKQGDSISVPSVFGTSAADGGPTIFGEDFKHG